jgi:steroid delta-isomerase-like uncharacterized protein
MADVAGLHREMFDAVMSRDFERLRDLCHPDYVYMSGDGEEQKGADAAVAVAQLYLSAFPDMRMEIRNQVAQGDVSVIEITARGRHDGPLGDIPATGREIEVVVCNVITARDGKIVREHEYFDNYSFLQKLGIVEE